MTLIHRGLTIDLPADDARIPVIEALLFGQTLPPPLPVPELADATPPKVEPPPPVPVPAKLRAFWEDLEEIDRRELALLAVRPHRPVEVEAALGLSTRKLMGQHSRINRMANRHGVRAWIGSKGRGREARRYLLEEKLMPLVRALAEGRAVVEEG